MEDILGPTLYSMGFVLALTMITYFSLAEISFFSCNKIRLDFLSKSGDERAIKLQNMLKDPDEVLISLLTLNTVAHTLAPVLLVGLLLLIVPKNMALMLSSLIATFLILFAGEILPKIFAAVRHEKIALGLTPSFYRMHKIFTPINRLITRVTDVVLGIFGVRVEHKPPAYTREELKHYVKMASEAGKVSTDEAGLIHQAMEFQGKKVGQIMIPMQKAFVISIDLPTENFVKSVTESGYTRVPVFQGTKENVLGVIYAKDLMNMMAHGKLIIAFDLLREPVLTTEDEDAVILLKKFRKERFHMAVVKKDGNAVGIVTLEDIVEEIIGEIGDEYDI